MGIQGKIYFYIYFYKQVYKMKFNLMYTVIFQQQFRININSQTKSLKMSQKNGFAKVVRGLADNKKIPKK